MFLGVLFVPILLVAFITTLIIIPKWIKRARFEGIVGRDVHKLGNVKAAEGGGVTVLVGFVISVFLYIALKTFIFKVDTNLIHIMGLVVVILFAGMIGSFDDLLGWKRGLSNRLRIVLLIFAAVPLMALNAGDSIMNGVDFGLSYPLLLVPIAIVGTTSTFNFLAGYNGLEATQGMIILTALAIVTYTTGNPWLSVIAMCMVMSLFAFYLFNKYPAKIFPGDTLTYPVGALIGAIAILGNIEKIAMIFFIPYMMEFFLKARGKLKKESFSVVQKDGSLKLKDCIYGLEHLAIWFLIKIKGKAYEKEIPFVIGLFQLIFIFIGFWLFFS